MAYWSELKAIVQPFPCLWDPQDPYFSDETVKAVCREQVLKICNQRSDVPIDMESLKQWLSDNLAQTTLQLQTAAEQHSITALPQDLQSISGEAVRNRAQEITAVEKLPQSVSGRVGENMAQNNTTAMENLMITEPLIYQYVPSRVDESVTQGLVPNIEDLIKGFPCLWNPKDLNYGESTMRRRCLKLILRKYNRLSCREITMGFLEKKLKTFTKRLNRRKLAIERSSPVNQKSVTPQGKAIERSSPESQTYVTPLRKPKLQDLLKEFPCLSDPNDLNYTDNNMRARYRQQLLEKCNSLSTIQITMSDLIRKINNLHKQQERHYKLKSLDRGDLKKLATSKQGRGRCNKPRLQDLMKEFPCLWDPTDLNYSDNTMRSRSRQQLLEKFNSLSTIQITMSDLRRKLDALRKKDYRYEPKLQDLLKEFPCLWDPNDSEFLDETIKEQSKQQLLEKFNSLCSFQITMSDLNRQLSVLRVRKKPKLQDLLKDFPCLWDPNDLNYSDVTIRAHSREQLLETFNNLSTVQITMSDLKRKLNSFRDRRQRREESKARERDQPLLTTEEQDMVNVQGREFLVEKVQDISGGHLQTAREREAHEITIEKIRPVINNTTQIVSGTSLDSTEPSCTPQVAPERGDLRKTLAQRGPERRNKEANRQTKVQGISEGHLKATKGEREVQEITVNSFRALFDKSQKDPKTSIDATESNQRPQGDPIQEALVLRGIEVIFDYCRFCGELKDCTESRNNPKLYLANNKCTLIINDIRAELELADELPKNICRDCDRKFQEMLDFVKCVKDAQVKLDKINNFNNETLDLRRKNDDTASEREADGQGKTCRITIDLSSDTLPCLSDNDDENNDIEMDFDDEIGSFFVINAESEQRNKTVSINTSLPSLSLCNENDKNMNSSNSHGYRAETPANFIKTYTDFVNNIPQSDKIVSKPLSYKIQHISTKEVCEDDVNSINIKIEDEMVNDINKQELNANEIDIKEEDIETAIAAARKKGQFKNNWFVSNRSKTD